jgi:hypothetical protein
MTNPPRVIRVLHRLPYRPRYYLAGLSRVLVTNAIARRPEHYGGKKLMADR